MNDQAYLLREWESFLRDMARADRGSAKDKRAAVKLFAEHAAGDPELVAERISWLLAGHYGKGAYDRAWELVGSRFVKPTSHLISLIATLEWVVPQARVNEAMAELTPEQLKCLHDAVELAVFRSKECS